MEESVGRIQGIVRGKQARQDTAAAVPPAAAGTSGPSHASEEVAVAEFMDTRSNNRQKKKNAKKRAKKSKQMEEPQTHPSSQPSDMADFDPQSFFLESTFNVVAQDPYLCVPTEQATESTTDAPVPSAVAVAVLTTEGDKNAEVQAAKKRAVEEMVVQKALATRRERRRSKQPEDLKEEEEEEEEEEKEEKEEKEEVLLAAEKRSASPPPRHSQALEEGTEERSEERIVRLLQLSGSGGGGGGGGAGETRKVSKASGALRVKNRRQEEEKGAITGGLGRPLASRKREALAHKDRMDNEVLVVAITLAEIALGEEGGSLPGTTIDPLRAAKAAAVAVDRRRMYEKGVTREARKEAAATKVRERRLSEGGGGVLVGVGTSREEERRRDAMAYKLEMDHQALMAAMGYEEGKSREPGREVGEPGRERGEVGEGGGGGEAKTTASSSHRGAPTTRSHENPTANNKSRADPVPSVGMAAAAPLLQLSTPHRIGISKGRGDGVASSGEVRARREAEEEIKRLSEENARHRAETRPSRLAVSEPLLQHGMWEISNQREELRRDVEARERATQRVRYATEIELIHTQRELARKRNELRWEEEHDAITAQYRAWP